MNKEVKQKWLEALRSGEYKQGKHALNTKHGFCCLGVLCDIYAKENNIKWESSGGPANKNYLFGESAYLPVVVAVWAGLEGCNPVVIDHGHQQPISNVNDEGVPFEQIADIIENQL